MEKITEDTIREFTDDDIVLSRGIDYFKRGRVQSIKIEDDRVISKVRGGGTDYEVTIRFDNGDIDADCSCPYKGLACKHVVAVLHRLAEVKKNDVDVETIDEEKNEIALALEEKTKEELIEIITDLLNMTEDMKDKILE